MWTERHRTRHEARLKDIVVQTGLDEMARLVERADPPGSAIATPARQVVAAIAWHLRVGGGWRALPAGFPPWRTVYGWFRRWIENGVFEFLMRALARRGQRRRCGRRPHPQLAIIDTQSVKCISVRGPRGYDRAKKQHWPSLRRAIFGGVFRAKRCEERCHLHGMHCEVVQKQPDHKGFVLLKWRWLVERTLGWFSYWGVLMRERAGRLAFVACLMAIPALA